MIGVTDTFTLSMDLSFPSELGYEKVARDAVAAFARRLGFDRERIEDLKTALGEACINAIEHGNGRAPGLHVVVSCVCAGELLTIEVHDKGLKRYQLRGMGLMMIGQLMDEAGFTESQDGGNHFRLALYRRTS